MPKRALSGSRIRRLRIDRGLRQAALARACGISPSYLNLIEHNKRSIGGALLNRISEELDVDPAMISEGAEAALTLALETAASSVQGLDRDAERSEELAGRFPGWARVIESQQKRLVQLEQSVETLNDRLTHDPFLSASLHNVLSAVTSIRSTSGILASGEPIEPEWQVRFHRNLYEDSQRLADAAEGLVTYLDAGADVGNSHVLPQDEVEAWLSKKCWRIDELEGERKTLPEEILLSSEELATDAGKNLARTFAAAYAADAEALPSSDLSALLSAGNSDPRRIATELSLSLPLVLRRLATLPDDCFAGGFSPGLVICDGSGTLTFRKPVSGFEPPRYGAACALWPLFQALQRPAMPIVEDVVLRGRDETHFTAYAISNTNYPAGYDGPPVVEATMLLMPSLLGDADSSRTIAIGSSCRVCSQRECPARRAPSILGFSDDTKAK
ncbi:MAG: helix-turn-helix domain-containing protein [Boseongicola sp.]